MKPVDDKLRHVTEGEVHTFLDGQVDALGEDEARRIRAHLAACSACRDRLVVEDAVRERAGALFAADDPMEGWEPPTLHDLRARATGPGIGTRMRRGGFTLGWAASVVLALGIGYGIGTDQGGLRDDVSGGVPLDDAGRLGRAVVESPEAASATPQSAPQSAPPSETGGVTVERATGPAAGAAPPLRIEPEAERMEVLAVVPAEAPAEVAAEEAAPVAVQDAVALGAVADARGGRGEAEVAAAVESPSRSVTLEARRTAPAATREAAAPSVSLDEMVVAGAAASVTEHDVSEVTFSGAQVTSVREVEVWPGQRGLSVRQTLADGRLVEVLLAKPSDAGPMRPPPRVISHLAGREWVAHERDGSWIVVAGALPVADLTALLDTLLLS